MQHGIPESIIQSWRKTQGEMLLPLQSQAVTNHDLLKGRSLIISAPTSSGKTFCGEMAAVVNLFKGMKVVFLVPLKAIAEEKYSDFGGSEAQRSCLNDTELEPAEGNDIGPCFGFVSKSSTATALAR